MREKLVLPMMVALGILVLGASGASAAANFTTTDITFNKYCDIFGCSVQFYSWTCNQDVISRSLVQGTKWGYGGSSIYTCTGPWDSSNSTTVNAGQCKWILTYGPGYVGPKVGPGVCLTVTSYADIYCQTAETSEADNSRTKTICL